MALQAREACEFQSKAAGSVKGGRSTDHWALRWNQIDSTLMRGCGSAIPSGSSATRNVSPIGNDKSLVFYRECRRRCGGLAEPIPAAALSIERLGQLVVDPTAERVADCGPALSNSRSHSYDLAGTAH
jgi:hypothetical protein